MFLFLAKGLEIGVTAWVFLKVSKMRINWEKYYITFLPWYVTRKLDSSSYFTHDGCCDFRTQVIDRLLQPSTLLVHRTVEVLHTPPITWCNFSLSCYKEVKSFTTSVGK